jgi:hypothetical protein
MVKRKGLKINKAIRHFTEKQGWNIKTVENPKTAHNSATLCRGRRPSV